MLKPGVRLAVLLVPLALGIWLAGANLYLSLSWADKDMGPSWRVRLRSPSTILPLLIHARSLELEGATGGSRMHVVATNVRVVVHPATLVGTVLRLSSARAGSCEVTMGGDPPETLSARPRQPQPVSFAAMTPTQDSGLPALRLDRVVCDTFRASRGPLQLSNDSPVRMSLGPDPSGAVRVQGSTSLNGHVLWEGKRIAEQVSGSIRWDGLSVEQPDAIAGLSSEMELSAAVDTSPLLRSVLMLEDSLGEGRARAQVKLLIDKGALQRGSELRLQEQAASWTWRGMRLGAGEARLHAQVREEYQAEITATLSGAWAGGAGHSTTPGGTVRFDSVWGRKKSGPWDWERESSSLEVTDLPVAGPVRTSVAEENEGAPSQGGSAVLNVTGRWLTGQGWTGDLSARLDALQVSAKSRDVFWSTSLSGSWTVAAPQRQELRLKSEPGTLTIRPDEARSALQNWPVQLQELQALRPGPGQTAWWLQARLESADGRPAAEWLAREMNAPEDASLVTSRMQGSVRATITLAAPGDERRLAVELNPIESARARLEGRWRSDENGGSRGLFVGLVGGLPVSIETLDGEARSVTVFSTPAWPEELPRLPAP